MGQEDKEEEEEAPGVGGIFTQVVEEGAEDEVGHKGEGEMGRKDSSQVGGGAVHVGACVAVNDLAGKVDDGDFCHVAEAEEDGSKQSKGEAERERVGVRFVEERADDKPHHQCLSKFGET